jgi:hypothetical protein
MTVEREAVVMAVRLGRPNLLAVELAMLKEAQMKRLKPENGLLVSPVFECWLRAWYCGPYGRELYPYSFAVCFVASDESVCRKRCNGRRTYHLERIGNSSQSCRCISCLLRNGSTPDVYFELR